MFSCFPEFFQTAPTLIFPGELQTLGRHSTCSYGKFLCFSYKLLFSQQSLEGLNRLDVKIPILVFLEPPPTKNFIATSQFIAEIQSDLPPKVEVMGNWFMDEPEYAPPHDLEEFIKRGPSPVVISFGSMMVEEGKETAKIVLDAIKRSGQRAIIQKGWGHLELDNPSENIKFVDYIPHTYLLPHALCLIHHCGAGTTASACRAGIPSIPVPHGVDQFAWAHWLKQRGVAPKAIDRKYLNSKVLADRIKEVANNPSYSQKAKALSIKIAEEKGIEKTIKVIENFQEKESLAG